MNHCTVTAGRPIHLVIEHKKGVQCGRIVTLLEFPGLFPIGSMDDGTAAPLRPSQLELAK